MELEYLLQSLNSLFLLVGDQNGRQQLWDDNTEISKSAKLASLVEEKELVMFNTDEKANHGIL